MRDAFRAVSREQAARIQLMYQEMDEFGRRKYTLAELAELNGCGETTVYRIVNRKGPYRAIAARNPEEIEIAAKASREAFMTRMGKEVEEARAESTEGETKADRLLAELSPQARARAKRLLGEEE